MDLKELAALGGDQDAHWYYASKSKALLRCLEGFVPDAIADVGAGSGYFSKVLLRDTPALRATCIDPGYPDDRTETCAGKPLRFRRAGSAADANLVLLLDVLEHVDDDLSLLRTYAESARPQTRFVLSVPAFALLWGKHDEYLEHRRRYTLPQLEALLAPAGLSRLAGFYFFAAIFPAVAAVRLAARAWPSGGPPASDLRPHGAWTNRILRRICVAESAVAPANRAFGLTAFAVAEKR